MKSVASLLAACAFLVLAASTQAQDAPNVGDVVFAQQKPDIWPHGKITKKTDKGFVVEFDDGSKATVASALIAIDKVPEKEAVKVGARVAAKWKADGKFYPGKINKINDDGTFHVAFDDGDKADVGVKGIRLVSP